MHLFLLGWTTVIRYYPAVLKNSLKSLQLIETAAAVLTGTRKSEVISPTLSCLQ